MQRIKRVAGFTLIELLVVIAIIGILAAVVLASLNDARDSGQDASIKQSIGNARAQAELIYNTGTPQYSYESVCESTTIQRLMTAAKNNRAESTGANVVTDATASASTAVTCHDSDGGYAIVAPLNVGGNSWCIDSTGFAGTIAYTALGASDYTCN